MRTWTWTNRDEIEDRRCHRTSLELAARPTDPLNALAEQHRVRQARENIRAGTYDEPGVVEVAVDRMLAVIE